MTKFKFFFSFPRVIIPPLPLHIFKTHSLLLWIFPSIFNLLFFSRSLFTFLRDPLFKSLLENFVINTHIHIHYGTGHLFISCVCRTKSDLFFSLQASESATVISNTGNVRLILDFGFPQWPLSQRGMTHTD